MYESPRVDLVDLRLDGVEAEHGHAGLGEGGGERQADVAEADHADPGSGGGQAGGGGVVAG